MPQNASSGFAQAALAVARDEFATPGESLVVNLPGIRFEIRTKSPTFSRACRTSLINDPSYADGNQSVARVLVADAQNYPALPAWPEHTRELQDELMAEAIAARHQIAFNEDFDEWHFFDPVDRIGVQLMPHSDAYPHWEDSFPLVPFVHWITMEQSRRVVHAASLGREGRGVLIAGDSGAGKSGTTLAGVLGGLDSIGDDYVLIDMDGEGVRGLPLTRIMKQDAKGLARNGVGADKRFWGPNWQGKHETYVSDLTGREMPKEFRLAAVLLPEITGRQTRLVKASGREAVMALLPSNLVQLGGRRRYAVQFISELARRLPAFHLELGPDPAEIARVVSDFLGRE